MQKELLDITEYLHETGDAIKVYMNMEHLKKNTFTIVLVKNPDNSEEAYKLNFIEGEGFLLFKYNRETLTFLQKHFNFTYPET